MNRYLLYEEKQYIGQNRLGQILRLLFAMLCFIAYYWSENPKPVKVVIIKIGSYPIQHIAHSGTVFFWLGWFILILSLVFNFIYHFHLQIFPDRICIQGMLTSREVIIYIKDIKQVKIKSIRYSFLRNIRFNLRKRNKVHFYTFGNKLLEIETHLGERYVIGTNHARWIKRMIVEIMRNSV
ncbi:MAG: hypothetical protein D6799_01800 [Bacteroidetes bacterium]|nr:MAG: hypothetical protein D6799_01800 [Bacteroidota bacterium]